MKTKLSENSEPRKLENKNVVEEVEGKIKLILENTAKGQEPRNMRSIKTSSI